MLPFQIETLSTYFKQLSQQYQVTLHVAGLLEYTVNKEHPLSFLSEYILHKNPYCMYLKSNRSLWSRCIQSKQCIIDKLNTLNDSMLGVCHCGVAEYLVPVRRYGNTVGFLSAGYYRPDDATLQKRLRATAQQYDFSMEDLRRIYSENIPLRRTVTHEIEVAAGMLSLLFSSLVEDHGLWPLEFLQSQRSDHWLTMQKAQEYLQIHYSKPIITDDLAAFCLCSRSTLQHLFKKLNGVSIGTFLKNIRMKKAGQLLLSTSQPVGKIAEAVGYPDANYFTLIFSKTYGLPPSEYRKQKS